MKLNFRHIAAGPCLAGLRISRALKSAPDGFRILIFHDIPDHAAPTFGRLVNEIVGSHGAISPEQAADWLSGDPHRRPSPSWRAPYLFTFDDGFASNCGAALDILNAHDIKALFFVCPKLLDLSGSDQQNAIVKNIFQDRPPAALPAPLKLMSWDDVLALAETGHSIGCHGMNHRRLAGLNDDDLSHEILDAADTLKNRTGRETPWFAYSFGDIDSINARAMEIISSRFRFCRSGIRGINTATTSPTRLLAEQLDLAASPTYWKLVLEGGLDFCYESARRRLRDLAP